MKSTLDQLKEFSTVVADTGEFTAIKAYQPEDATTNPSLLYKVAQQSEFESLIHDAIAWAQQQGGTDKEIESNIIDKFSINVGTEILKVIPGRVSTEVDAAFSFNTQATIDKAKRIIDLYNQHDISPDRVLIKIASTWEGIQAAKELEKLGIQCNLTLLFSITQAIACADAGAFLISPFVGRILDWYKLKENRDYYEPHEDPGVNSVTRIYQYYKQHNYDTVVMAASFRNTEQIKELAGCDRLTISPQLLEELQQDKSDIEIKLHPEKINETTEKQNNNEITFRWHLNEDAMATEKLAEGIRLFNADHQKLINLIQEISQK